MQSDSSRRVRKADSNFSLGRAMAPGVSLPLRISHFEVTGKGGDRKSERRDQGRSEEEKNVGKERKRGIREGRKGGKYGGVREGKRKEERKGKNRAGR